MSLVMGITLMNIIFFLNFETSSTIWVGEKFPGYRVVVMNIEKDNIIVEVGGTSLKMGGDIFFLERKLSDDSERYAASETENTYIKKCKDRYYLVYDGKLGKRKYKLKEKKYSQDIERIRLRIFTSHFYKSGEKSPQEINDQFDEFKKNPISFME